MSYRNEQHRMMYGSLGTQPYESLSFGIFAALADLCVNRLGKHRKRVSAKQKFEKKSDLNQNVMIMISLGDFLFGFFVVICTVLRPRLMHGFLN